MSSEWTESTHFARIGRGGFGSVYAWQSRSVIAVKQVADPTTSERLRREYRVLNELYRCSVGLSIAVPKPGKYYDSYWEFAEEMKMGLSLNRGLNQTGMYTMQRFWPVPPQLGAEIAERFFPNNEKQCHHSFVARVYLGRTNTRTSRFFQAENFPLTTPMMEQIGLPVTEIALDMGRMLSRVQHRAGQDGQDIEFILGAKDDALEPGVFCIDFDKTTAHLDSVDAMVAAVKDNDPYYPKADSAYWDNFVEGYLLEAGAEKRELASQVIAGIMRETIDADPIR